MMVRIGLLVTLGAVLTVVGVTIAKMVDLPRGTSEYRKVEGPTVQGPTHLMYNCFGGGDATDRRYLPVGLALLDEGIANNPDVFDSYKEKGWKLFDKVKDYPEAAAAYERSLSRDQSADLNVWRWKIDSWRWKLASKRTK